jgi:transitional endoplasmic reticulum ATPase
MSNNNQQDQLSKQLLAGLAGLMAGKVRADTEPDNMGHVGIERKGEKIIIPETMSPLVAAGTLIDIAAQEEQDTAFSKTFRYIPQDGANALDAVLTRIYGRAPAKEVQTMFGTRPPKQISIKVGPNEEKMVLWGRFALPGLDDGYIETAATIENNMYVFALNALVKKKHKPKVEIIFEAVEEYLKSDSIYNGKAIKVGFRDNDGEPLETLNIEFIDTSKINPEELIYSDQVFDEINTYLFTPLRRPADCSANGIPLKRGICLGGPYGTGKTLAAFASARYAVESGMTYVYCQRANEVVDGINFSKMYQRVACVLFAEDIDRETSGERTVSVDDILNNIDGIESKYNKIITVFTTNDIKAIHQGMMRPGRLDAIIEVTPPDAVAAEKLVRMYAGDTLAPNADLTEVGQVLNGQIPAVISEVVKRAKLHQLTMQPKGESVISLSSKAFLHAAKSITRQVEMLNEDRTSNVDRENALLRNLYDDAVRRGVVKALTHAKVTTNHEAVKAELVLPPA